MTIVVTGGTPDSLNSNKIIRQYMCDGLRATSYKPIIKNVCQSHLFDILNRDLPEIIFVCGSLAHPQSITHSITRFCKANDVKLVYWLHDDPYEFDFHWKIDSSYEKTYIFTNERNCLDYYDFQKVFFCPLAAPVYMPKSVHDADSPTSPDIKQKMFFCGYAYEERKSILSQIAKSSFLRQKLFVLGDGWDDNEYCFNKRISPSLLNILYQTNAFVLNIGRDLNIANSRFAIPASSPGPRTFEAAMMGALQLYLVQSDSIVDFYTEDDGVFRVNSLEQIEDLFNDMKCRPEVYSLKRRQAIQTTKRYHTYANRAQKILDIIVK